MNFFRATKSKFKSLSYRGIICYNEIVIILKRQIKWRAFTSSCIKLFQVHVQGFYKFDLFICRRVSKMDLDENLPMFLNITETIVVIRFSQS